MRRTGQDRLELVLELKLLVGKVHFLEALEVAWKVLELKPLVGALQFLQALEAALELMLASRCHCCPQRIQLFPF